MKRRGNKGKQDLFSEALRGKKIPVLTLDNKWYQLLDQKGKNQTAGQVEKLNQLLKDLGKVNTEAKNIRALKKKLMQEIISMVDEAAQKPDSGLDEKIENHKKMVEECSGRLADYEERQLELPRQIDEINFQLMLKTMEYCYDTMQANEEEISWNRQIIPCILTCMIYSEWTWWIYSICSMIRAGKRIRQIKTDCRKLRQSVLKIYARM